MAKLGSVPQHSDEGQTDVIVSLCSLGLMLCLVVVVLGIKFRWFKQRLSFEPIPTGTGGSADNGQVVLKRSSRNSQEQFREPVVAQGIFRKKLDEDVVYERPKTLPPVRVRKASKGPPSFGPPKRSETPSSTVEEPIVAPPPPPPLPSSSSSGESPPHPFAKTRVRTALSEDNEDKKVNFDTSTQIIPNGETNSIHEELMSEEDQSNRQSIDRRQTGYVRPSDEIMQELQDFHKETEPPKVQPRRSILSNKSNEKPSFKKNASKAGRITTEPLKTENGEIDSYKLGQRRLTGFFQSPADDHNNNVDESTADRHFEKKTSHNVVFHLDDDDDANNDDDDDDEDDDDEKVEPKSPAQQPTTPPPPPPPILFSSQISTEDDHRDSTDSWSAIQRHRNLAREISEQHQAMQNRRKENGEAAAEFRNPLAAQQQPKPRTMRDMRRNNARSDLLLDAEKNDTEA